MPVCLFFRNPNPLSSSALEELRAAHNLISEVPSSLGKNVALRTLDLGHNTIEGWGGLERVGKTLASLVQITLAGNPLCTNAPSGMLVLAVVLLTPPVLELSDLFAQVSRAETPGYLSVLSVK